MRRAAAALAAAGLIVAGTAGCETTQDLSAKIGRKLGHQSAIAGTTTLGAVNRDVRVDRTVLLSAGGQSAVALKLTNTSARTQIAFPVLIDVLDAKGASVYRNNTKGIEPSIQQLALLAPHATVWWVDNEVLASGGVPKTVSGQLGASTARPPRVVPQITTQGVSASDGFPGPHVTVTVRNRSAIVQRQLPVYAVALRGEELLGAGRGIVPSLAAGASAQIQIPIVGTVGAATIVLTIPPTGLA
jgi:hypothetical protein